MALGILILGGCSPRPEPYPDIPDYRPNFIILLLDALRADHMGCYGYNRPTTPNIDRFAAEGIRYEDCLTVSPWTLPSVVSLHTSLYPGEHGACDFMGNTIATHRTTMAQHLGRAGYNTAVFSAHSLGMSVTKRGVKTLKRPPGEYPGADSVPVIKETLQWLRQNYKDPFYIYIHLLDPHGPYEDTRFVPNSDLPYLRIYDFAPEERYRHPVLPEDARRLAARGLIRPGSPEFQAMLDRYDGDIARCDENLAPLLDFLRESGIDERTLTVVLADHGEEFLEHGFVEHRWQLFQESIRIPLIVRWKGHLPEGRVLSEPVSILDVMPTFLYFAGLPLPEVLRGEPLPFSPSRGPSDRRRLVELDIYYTHRLRGLVMGGYKLIAQETDPSVTYFQMLRHHQEKTRLALLPEPLYSLYNLEVDATEQRNLAQEEPQRLEEMKAELMAVVKDIREASAYLRQGSRVDPEELDALRSVGYVE